MARDFHRHNAPPWPFSADATGETIAGLIDAPNGFVAIGGGFIAGLIVPNPISPEWIIAKEFLWWSEGKDGPRLLRHFREWAKSQGVNEIQYSRPAKAERVGRFYDRIARQSEIVHSEFCHVS